MGEKIVSLKNQTDGLDDTFDLYLSQIGKFPLLTRDEEVELARQIQSGDKKAKLKLFESNRRLVVSIAKVYTKSGLPIQDLVQYGNIGLLVAIEQFDGERGFRFSTYATNWIKQKITRGIADEGRAIRLPSYIQDEFRKISKQIETLCSRLGETPALEKLAELLDISVQKLTDYYILYGDWITSIDQNSREEDDRRQISDKVIDPCPSVVDQVFSTTQSDYLYELLETVLDPREQLVIEKRFALRYGRVYTLEEIAKELKITRERIRQIERRALSKLNRKSFKKDVRDGLLIQD